MTRKRDARSRQVRRNLRRAFALARDVVQHPEAYPERFVAIPLEPETVRRLLSTERVRLLRQLRDEGPFDSVGELAEALRREPTRVSRDVSALAGAGLVVVERHGKRKRVRAPRRPIVLA